MPLPYENSILKIIEGKEVQFHIRYGFMPVHVPEFKKPLNMVVIKGLSGKPGILLTSLQINSKEKDLWFVISDYLKRWSIEETIRFVKQTYDLENIRV
jgi:hypothetical protein